MQYLDRINEFINNNNVDLTEFRHSVRSSVLNLILMEYCKNMKEVKIPVSKIEVPELKPIIHMLARDSIFIEKLSGTFIDSLCDNNITKNYLPDTPIFKEENIELLKGFFDTIIPNDLAEIPIMIKDRFLQENSNFREKVGLSILRDINMSYISFLIEETALFMAIKKNDIHSFPERNDPVVTEDTILEIKSPFTGFPIYINMKIMDNPIIMDSISFVYQFSYNKLMNSYTIHFDKPSNFTSIIEIE